MTHDPAVLDAVLLDPALGRSDGALELLYQPEVDLRTGAIVAMEALLRLHVADLGVLAPAEFLDAVERTGRDGRVGQRVLETAAREAALWQGLRGPRNPGGRRRGRRIHLDSPGGDPGLFFR